MRVHRYAKEFRTIGLFTGEPHDPTGLIHLRARYYSPQQGRFLTVDPFEGMAKHPYSQHPYQYGYSNPVKYTDPSGMCSKPENIAAGCPPWMHDLIWEAGVDRGIITPDPISCRVGRWDCEAVQNVRSLREAFINSAKRHNRIPTMTDNDFAALLAAVIVSERRIGNIPLPGKERDRNSIRLEDGAARIGCTVSGHYLDAARKEGDWPLFLNI